LPVTCAVTQPLRLALSRELLALQTAGQNAGSCPAQFPLGLALESRARVALSSGQARTTVAQEVLMGL